MCSFTVVAIVVIDEVDVGLGGCQHFRQGFILILVKGENIIL